MENVNNTLALKDNIAVAATAGCSCLRHDRRRRRRRYSGGYDDAQLGSVGGGDVEVQEWSGDAVVVVACHHFTDRTWHGGR